MAGAFDLDALARISSGNEAPDERFLGTTLMIRSESDNVAARVTTSPVYEGNIANCSQAQFSLRYA